VIITMVVVLAGAGVAVAVVVPLRHRAKPGPVDNAAGTSLATVARQTLTSQTSVSGTLGYAGTYDVINQARGTLTAAPAIGQVIHQGQVLYRVDGKPVVLLYGSTPAYRALAEGSTASDVSGPDVRQLNHDLVALGYASKADLDPNSDEFSWATKAAVEKLQDDLDVDETGSLALGQIVFLPAAIRITSVVATVGGQAGSGPLLKATSTARQVIVALDAAQQSTVRVGDQVVITLPDNRATPGRVASVGKVATVPSGSSSSTPTIEVHIAPTHPASTGRLDQAPVQVSITTDTVRDALVVPVNALLSLAGGGYAVEVAADEVRRLVPVSLGLFDDSDGLVQITGAGIRAGQHVVVPAT